MYKRNMYKCNTFMRVLLITFVFEIEYRLYEVELSIKENEIYKRLGNNIGLIYLRKVTQSHMQ